MKTNTLMPVIKAILNDEEFKSQISGDVFDYVVEFLLKKNNMRKNMI